jgi:hypothetical protein
MALHDLRKLLLSRPDVDAVLPHLDDISTDAPPHVRLFLAAPDEVIPLGDPETSVALVRAVASWLVKVAS